MIAINTLTLIPDISELWKSENYVEFLAVV